MGQNTARRSLGTALMGLGLILVLGVAGYFAWSEIQSAQVRAQLQDTAPAIAVPTAPATAEHPAAATAEHPAAATADPAESSAAPAPTRVTPEATRNKPAAAAAQPVKTATRKPLQASATPRPSKTATPATGAPAAAPGVTPAAVAAPLAAAASPVEPVRMTIPDLKIDAAVVPMGWEVIQTKDGPISQWVIPKDAAGHHINSAGIGEPGNLVISGHNNIYGQVFKPISLAWDNDTRVKVDSVTDRSDILNGRTIELFDAQGEQHSYVITEFYRLKDTGVSQAQRIGNGQYILPTGDERITLVTCWPPNNNTHRLIVIARPEE